MSYLHLYGDNSIQQSTNAYGDIIEYRNKIDVLDINLKKCNETILGLENKLNNSSALIKMMEKKIESMNNEIRNLTKTNDFIINDMIPDFIQNIQVTENGGTHEFCGIEYGVYLQNENEKDVVCSKCKNNLTDICFSCQSNSLFSEDKCLLVKLKCDHIFHLHCFDTSITKGTPPCPCGVFTDPSNYQFLYRK